ncbi:hypothetical protein ACOME3_003945 [Neoechinorhynchus agilis]
MPLFDRDNKKSKDKDAREEMKVIIDKAEEERKEIRKLNTQLEEYLKHVRELDLTNQKLNDEIEKLKEQWGFDEGHEKENHDAGLNDLRKKIDVISGEKMQYELKARRAQYDIYSYTKGLNLLEINSTNEEGKILELQALNDALEVELDTLNFRLENATSNPTENEDEIKKLMERLEYMKNNYDNESLQRVQLQNELQTLEEKIGFMNAIYEERTNDMKKITSVQIDTTGFYKKELQKAIYDIREDFNKLRAIQKNDLKAFYKAKIEEITQAVKEKERKDKEHEKPEQEVTDLTETKNALASMNRDRDGLMHEMARKEAEYQSLLVKAEEQARMLEASEADQLSEIEYTKAKIRDLEMAIAAILEGNVSLEFEISTYRTLLKMEKDRLDSPDRGVKTISKSSTKPKNKAKQILKKLF